MADLLPDGVKAQPAFIALHRKQAVDLVKVATGIPNPPEWLLCAYLGVPYRLKEW